MSLNLLDLVKSQVSPQLINKAASLFGESESATNKAVEGVLPAIISGLMNQATTQTGAQGILDLISKHKIDGSLLAKSGSLMSNPNDSHSFLEMGEHLVGSIFGDKTAGLVDFISNFSGVKSSSATSLLSMATPLVMSAVGKQVQGGNLNASGLSSMLMGQSGFLQSLLPTGLASILGISSFDGMADAAKASFGSLWNSGTTAVNTASNSVKSTVNTASKTVEEVTESGLPKWLLPLLLLLAALGLLFFLMKGCNKSTETGDVNTAIIDSTANSTKDTVVAKVENTVSSIKAAFDSLTGTVNYDLGAIITHKLPNGTEIKFAENGSEAMLIKFLETGTIDTLDKSKGWINLYDVQFVKNLEYRKGATEQVANIAAILKAYPNAHIKLGGYTDNTGPADVNQKLSQSRADKVKAELAKLGSGKQVAKAEGYGPEHPVCEANDSPECKAQNRRVSLKVVAK